MFDIGFFELLVIGVLALLILGPERLPHAARTAGLWVGRVKRAFSSVQQEVNQQLHLEEMQRQLEENRRKLEETLRRQEEAIAAQPAPRRAADTSEAVVADMPRKSSEDEGPYGSTPSEIRSPETDSAQTLSPAASAGVPSPASSDKSAS